MINKKETCLVVMCMVLACALSVSCGKKPERDKEEREVVFNEGIIPIKMVTPTNWTMDNTYRYQNDSHYSTESISTMRIDNSLKESVQGDKGLSFSLKSPFFIGSKDIETIIPDFETLQKHRCGNNDVYISVPLKAGYVHFDGKYLIRIVIEHWPKNGMTPEMESFFSSLHVD